MKDNYTKSRILLLHPKAIPIFTSFIEKAEKDLDITIRITDGFRTFDQQTELYSHGRTKLKDEKGNTLPVITNSKGGQSFHNYGLAIDICVIENDKPDYGYDNSKIAEIGKEYTINWGGWFQHFADRPHFELSFGHTVKELLDLYYKQKPKNGFVQF